MSDQELRVVALQGECAAAMGRLIEESALSDSEKLAIRKRRVEAILIASEGDANAVLCLCQTLLRELAKDQVGDVARACAIGSDLLANLGARAFLAVRMHAAGDVAISVRCKAQHCRCAACREKGVAG